MRVLSLRNILSDEDGSVVYNCYWSSPAQSFSDPIPTGLMTTFYCLRIEIHPTWRARSPYLYPPGTRRPGYTPRPWVPFSSPPTIRRATVEVFDPASTWDTSCTPLCALLYLLGTDPTKNTVFCYKEYVFIDTLRSNSCPIVGSETPGICLPSRCPAMVICVIILNKSERTSRNFIGYAKLSELA
jgi:hypothetical protein